MSTSTQLHIVVVALVIAQFCAWVEMRRQRGVPGKPFLDKGLRLLRQQYLEADDEKARPSLEVELDLLKDDDQFNGRNLWLWCSGAVFARDTELREYPHKKMPVPLRDGGYSPVAGPDANCVVLKLREAPEKPIRKIAIRVFSHDTVSLLRAEWK